MIRINLIRERNKPGAPIGVKRCSSCGKIKLFSGFYRDSKRKKDGLYPRCMECLRNYYYQNRDRANARHRAYYRKHKDRLKVLNQTYVEKNREEVRANQKAYSDKRYFYIRIRNLKSRHLNQEVASMQEIARLWKKQRGICPFTKCRLTRTNAHLDHIVPVASGGQGTIGNLRWVHENVNRAKHDLSDAEFIRLCKLVASAN